MMKKSMKVRAAVVLAGCLVLNGAVYASEGGGAAELTGRKAAAAEGSGNPLCLEEADVEEPFLQEDGIQGLEVQETEVQETDLEETGDTGRQTGTDVIEAEEGSGLKEAGLGEKSGSCGTYLTWEVSADGRYLTIKGSGEMQDCYEDGVMNMPWAEYATFIETVEINEGAAEIGERAFYNCRALKTVYIPKSMKDIEDEAFKGCDKLADVYYGGTRIAWGAVEVDDTNSELTKAAFHYADDESASDNSGGENDGGQTGTDSGSCGGQLTWEYTEADRLLVIKGSGEIQDCFEEGVMKMPWAAYASVIETVKIGEGATEIGERAFYNCSALKSVYLPVSLKDIEEEAFSGCGKLTDVYYAGTRNQWASVDTDAYNSELLNAQFHYSYADGGSGSSDSSPSDNSSTPSDNSTASDNSSSDTGNAVITEALENTGYTVEYTASVQYDGRKHVDSSKTSSKKQAADINIKLFLNGQEVGSGEYDVKFRNNINVWDGKNDDREPYFEIKLKGKVDGKIKKEIQDEDLEFSITPLSLTEAAPAAKKVKIKKNGKVKIAGLSFTNSGGKAVKMKPYNTSSRKGDYEITSVTDSAVVITGRNNFTGTWSVPVK